MGMKMMTKEEVKALLTAELAPLIEQRDRAVDRMESALDWTVAMQLAVEQRVKERDDARRERDWAKNDVRKIGEERNEAIRERDNLLKREAAAQRAVNGMRAELDQVARCDIICCQPHTTQVLQRALDTDE